MKGSAADAGMNGPGVDAGDTPSRMPPDAGINTPPAGINTPPAGTQTPQPARPVTVIWYVLALGLLFVVALGARTIGLGGAVTEDEDQWIARSGTFARGLAIHDWRRTYLTGHPGVTTMWLTTLTLGIERTRPFERGTGAPDVTTVPDFLPALERARVPFAVLQAGLVVVAAVLVGRLLGPGTGLVAGLLFAGEPFWAGVGPIVGMDGLLTSFLTVSLLALLLACGLGAEPPLVRDEATVAEKASDPLGAPPGWPPPGLAYRGGHPGRAPRPPISSGFAPGLRERVGWAALAGGAFGLAFLSKTTALFAAPVIVALALLVGWCAWRSRVAGQFAADQPGADLTGAEHVARTQASVDGVTVGQRAEARWWVVPLALGFGWAASAALVVWLLWPAAWSSPIGTLERAITFSARLGGTPHGPGNFLLGEPVDDPGPLFYPVALALRLGPGTLIGLLLLLLVGAPVPARRVVWSLLGSIALFLILLMVAPKKVDRYLLPILPALAVLAAVGWTEAARRLSPFWTEAARRLSPLFFASDQERTVSSGASRTAPIRRPSSNTVILSLRRISCSRAGLREILQYAVATLAFGLQVWPLVQAGPYPLAAYNPLVGGVQAAERAIPVGWGDGLDVAGQRIRELAGGRTVVTSIWSPLRVSFGAHAPGPVVSERQIGQADFYVDYIHARQRRLTPRQLLNRQPDAVVTIGGVDYARIYRLR